MSAANLGHALSLIFGSEGAFTDNRADPGNWTGGKVGVGSLHGTKYGIAANTYPDLDIKNLTLADATEIYRRDYASKIRFDDLPAGVDYATLDYAVNSGPQKAAMDLQHVAGVDSDGQIGPKTLAAVKAIDPTIAINNLCDRRLAFLKRLRTWMKFGKGWSRRIATVRSEALRMIA